jgi:hypothetical protein
LFELSPRVYRSCIICQSITLREHQCGLRAVRAKKAAAKPKADLSVLAQTR